MLQNTSSYAVITGASKGLGKVYALELARRGCPLLLVAKKNEGLQEFSESITKKYNVKADYFETDLTKVRCLKEFVAWVNTGYSIQLLINNAGIGGTEKFDEAKIDFINDMIKLNIRAVSFITHELLPNLMKTSGKAYILNVSSMAAFCPLGYKTVYPASKKFIQYFSEGLNYELQHKNVSVATVFPGPMNTNLIVRERIEKQGFMLKLSVQSPEKVAKISLDKTFRGKTFIIVGFMNKINYILLKIIPANLLVPFILKRLEKELVLTSDLHGTTLSDSSI